MRYNCAPQSYLKACTNVFPSRGRARAQTSPSILFEKCGFTAHTTRDYDEALNHASFTPQSHDPHTLSAVPRLGQ
jgi:hypothetical protein